MANLPLNNFSGGMGFDDKIVGKGQYIYSDGFDLSRYPGELVPMLDFTDVENAPARIEGIFEIGGSDPWYGTVDGKIYEYGATLIHDTGFNDPVVDMVDFHGYTYAFCGSRILRFTRSGSTLSAQTTIRTQTNAYAKPVMYAGSALFYAGGTGGGGDTKKVTIIDQTDVAQDLLSEDFSTDVQGLSVQGNYLRVYTRNMLVIIDIGSRTVAYSMTLPFVTNGVVSDGKVDYVTTDAQELYVCSGMDYQQIAETTYSGLLENSPAEDGYKFNFKSSAGRKAMAFANDRLYVADNYYTYMIYGSKGPDFPKTIFYGLVDSSAASIDQVNAVFARNNDVYIGFLDGSQWKIGYLPHNNYSSTNENRAQTCTLVTASYEFDFSLIKALDEIRVGMVGQGLLYVSLDGGAYTLAGNLDQAELQQKIMGYKKNFREISLCVVLNANTYLSKLSNIDVRFTPQPI